MSNVVDGSTGSMSVIMDLEPDLPDSTTNGETDDLFLDQHNENHMLQSHDLVTDTRLKRLEKNVDSLLAGQMKIIKMIDMLTVAGKHSRRQSHKRASPTSHQGKTKARPPSANDMSTLLHLPHALQENIRLFTKDLMFTRETGLPDELVERECLSEDDYERIFSKTTTIDQVRVLIRKIKDKGPKVIQTFLDVLTGTQLYAHIADSVRKSTERIAEKHKGIPACVVCVMTACVDIKDIVDDLWKESMISDDLHGQIVEGDNTYSYRSIFWKQVTLSINQVSDKQNAMDVLKEALNSNSYSYIVEYLNQIPKESTLSCCCCKRRGLRPRPSNRFYESESEYSATCHSGQMCQNLPSRDLLFDSDESSGQSCLQSSDFKTPNKMYAMSFDTSGLRSFDSIGGRCQDSVDFSRGEDSPRSRHVSGIFMTQTSVQHESEEMRSLQYLHEQFKSDHLAPAAEIIANGVSLDPIRPDYNRSVSKQSNVTLQGEKTDTSSSSQEHAYDTAYKRSSSSDGAGNSLDKAHDSCIDKNDVNSHDGNNNVPAHALEDNKVATDNTRSNMDTVTIAKSKNCDNNNTGNGDVPLINEPKMNNKITVPVTSYAVVQSEGDKGNFADAEDDYEKQNDAVRRNRFRHRKLRIQNRKLTPFTGGLFVTSSKPVTDNAESKLPARQSMSRRSKASKNRYLRRQKSHQESDSGIMREWEETSPLTRDDNGDKGMKIPYSPMRGNVPQPKLVPRWDYNQVRRRRQMFQYHLAPPVTGGQSISDTDARTEGSDMFTCSDYTV